jgi:hypothetical protein
LSKRADILNVARTNIRGYSPLFFWNIRELFWLIQLVLFLLLSELFSQERFNVIVKFKSPEYGNTFLSNNTFSKLSSRLDSIGDLSIDKSYPIFSDKIYPANSEFNKYYFLNVVSDNSLPEIVNQLEAHPDIIWAEPNFTFKVHFTPNDSLFENQWALKRIELPEAWDMEKGDSGIIIGIIDTGIDYTHEDLKGQLWINQIEDINGNGEMDLSDLNGIDDDDNGYVDDLWGWDFTDAPNFPDRGDFLEPDNDPMDEYPGGHGTPVAGIVAATTDNKKGISGIAPGTKIMALRAGTASGFLEEDDVAEAILYAVQNGCQIVNMSFGDVVYSHLIKEAVEYGSQKGIIFVASAGNSGNNDLQYPACYDETISVGATDNFDNLAAFSNFGPKIDLVAPGQDILSLSLNQTYGSVSGTSFAAPIVTGCLALLRSHYPQASIGVIKSKLFQGCQDLGNTDRDFYYGHGLVNVKESLRITNTSFARITYPESQTAVKNAEVGVMGTAVGSEMKEFQLSYGIGKDSTNLILINSGTAQVIDNLLGYWFTDALPDSLYTLEIKAINHDLSKVTHRVMVEIDRTPPRLDSLNIIPLLIEDKNGYLIEVYTDDHTIATIKYRIPGESDFDKGWSSGYLNNYHNFLITQENRGEEYEFYIELFNRAQFKSRIDNTGHYFKLEFPQNFYNQNFELITIQPGNGYFYDKGVDLNGDGILDILINLKIPEWADSRLSVLNYTMGELKLFSSEIAAYPRDVFDIDFDLIPELLAGYGSSSYLFHGTNLPEFSEPPDQLAGSNLWAAKLINLQNDQNIELLAIQQNKWSLYQLENFGQFQTSWLASLENPTTGDNIYGVPKAEVGDLDNDGLINIIIGDYDGDIIIYENKSDLEIIPTSSISLPGVDATHRMATGDFDGDGVLELAVATQNISEYIGESAVHQNFWILSIIKSIADDSYEVIWQKNFYGVINGNEIFSGVTAADYDDDTKDELFFTPYPNAYYIQWDNFEYRLNWFLSGINSNAVPKLSANQFLLGGDNSMYIWEIEPEGTRPLPPEKVWISSVDTTEISLNWSDVYGADEYLIKRMDISSNIETNYTISENFFTDSLIAPDHLYLYRVVTVDNSFEIPNSMESREVKVRAETLPKFSYFEVVNRSQLIVEFTKPLGNKSFNVNNFILQPDSLVPVSATRGKNYSQILLSFFDGLPPGNHNLTLCRLVNYYNVPLEKDTLILNFNILSKNNTPYLTSVNILSKKKLELIFNEDMDKSSVENIQNYQILPYDEIVDAIQDPEQKNLVYLFLAGKNRIGSLGEKYYLEISNLKSGNGEFIPSDIGNKILLYQRAEDMNVITVFPNPLRVKDHGNKITFGNVPQHCEITIFTINGKMIVKLLENEYGALSWDLKNEVGIPVSSGIYLFVAKMSEQKKIGKFVIIQ